MNYLSGFFILLFCLNSIGYSQNIPNGLYVADGTDQFVCIKGDSISFNYTNRTGFDYYYGTFHIDAKEIVLDKNLAWGHGCFITTETCDSQFMEFEIVDLSMNYGIGAVNKDTTVYKKKSQFVHVYSETEQISRNTHDSIVRFKLGDFKDYTKENRFYVSSTGLFDKVNLPIQFGTRYVIHDKYHLCQISSLTDYDRKDRNTHFFHLRKKNIILIKINDGRKKTLKFKYKGNCESCLGELRKLYPDF